MKSTVYDATARFRVNERLLAAARAKASEEGRTFSELVRDALRRELAA